MGEFNLAVHQEETFLAVVNITRIGEFLDNGR